jgi:hypothetical protein
VGVTIEEFEGAFSVIPGTKDPDIVSTVVSSVTATIE